MQAGAEHLIEIGKSLHGLFLPDNLVPQRALKMAGRRTALSRVQHLCVAPLRCCCHNFSFRVVIQKKLGTRRQFQSPEPARSLVIHSRMYAGQFLILMLSVSQISRNLTASRSTRVRSFKSRTMRRPSGSDPNSVCISATFSASIRPLRVKTTSPFAALLIFSISTLLKPDTHHYKAIPAPMV